VDNFWKAVDKKLHENEIELENLDYAKHALKDTNNETQLIRAVTTNRTIGLLKHGLESLDEKSEGHKNQDQEEVKRRKLDVENYQHGKSSSQVRTSEHQISSESDDKETESGNFDANKRDPKNFTLDEFVDENDAPVRTPEHQISSSSSFVPLATRSESDVEETDSDNFDTNKRDPKNFTFDEFVDGNDEYVDDDDDVIFLNNLVTSYEDVKDNPYIFQEENISELFASYRSKALQMVKVSGLSIVTDYPEILSLSHILLLQAENFTDLQVQEFSRDTLEQLHKYLRNTHVTKTKVAPSVKAIFREYIKTVLDEDLGLNEAKKAVIKSFTKSFEDPVDQKTFDRMQVVFLQLMENIPVNPLNDLISEGTLTVNIISPILRSFFHDASMHPTT